MIYICIVKWIAFAGTVAASIADVDLVKHRDGVEESLEDGTTSFLSIASIRHGFRIVNTHNISSISRYGMLSYLSDLLLDISYN